MPQLTPIEVQLKNVLSQRFIGVDKLEPTTKKHSLKDRVITQINFFYGEDKRICTATIFVGFSRGRYIRYATLFFPDTSTLTYKF